MASKRTELKDLIKQGESFTYENFSQKGTYGYPAVLTANWVAWTTKTKLFVIRTAGPESPQLEMVEKGLAVPVMGNGPDKFEQCRAYLVGSLKAIEDSLSEAPKDAKRTPSKVNSKRVFVVHGHDVKSKTELEIVLGEMGLEPIVLHRQPDEGQTIIEKFEKHADVGFAFILLTPDEVAYLAGDAQKPETQRKTEMRARPNVIFEFGFFVGRLGRSRVCCLYTGNVSLPSDVAGLIYKRFERSIEEVAYGISRELKAAGYNLV